MQFLFTKDVCNKLQLSSPLPLLITIKTFLQEFLEQIKQSIIFACLEMQIHQCFSSRQHLVKENKQRKEKEIKIGKYEQVSLHRDSAGMINGAHTFHTWTIWETKLPPGTCFFFIPAIHKTQKEQPQSHKTLDSIMRIMHGLICSTKTLWALSAPIINCSSSKTEM